MEPGPAGADGLPLAGVEVGLKPEQAVHAQGNQASITINNGNGQIHNNKPRWSYSGTGRVGVVVATATSSQGIGGGGLGLPPLDGLRKPGGLVGGVLVSAPAMGRPDQP